LEIIDNGSGFSTAPASGRGLVNMRARAARLGGAFELVSAVGEGTMVTLTVAITAAGRPAGRANPTEPRSRDPRARV
jgi:signal transduction histidine kinase